MQIWKTRNGQGERILESVSLMAVMKCKVVLCCVGCQWSIRMQCLLIPRLKKHVSRKCAISRQVEQAESLQIFKHQVKNYLFLLLPFLIFYMLRWLLSFLIFYYTSYNVRNIFVNI